MLLMAYPSASYVDDFSLIVASPSYEQNSRKLTAAFDSLVAQGTVICPEATHWGTSRQIASSHLSHPTWWPVDHHLNRCSLGRILV